MAFGVVLLRRRGTVARVARGSLPSRLLDKTEEVGKMKANKWIILAVIVLLVVVLSMKQRADRVAPGPPGAQETPADTAEPAPSPAAPRATEPPKPPPPPTQAEEGPQAPTESEATGTTSAAEATPTAVEPSQEPAAPAEPRQEKPLSGAKLAECLASGRPTLVEFGANHCPACRRMEPVIEEAAAKYKGKAHVVYVDVVPYARVAHKYGIRLIPTQIFFGSDGKEATRHIGYYPLTDIARELAALGVGR